jgi:peptide/nickel transport system ATP-binding protein
MLQVIVSADAAVADRCHPRVARLEQRRDAGGPSARRTLCAQGNNWPARSRFRGGDIVAARLLHDRWPIAPSLSLLEVSNLHVTLNTARGPADALRGVSFRLERGQTLGLIGESGCGKSITALAIMGLLPEGAQVRGSMRFEGHELATLPEADYCQLRGDRIGMVFQEPMTALNPLHTVGRQIAESLRLHRGMAGAASRAEALRLLQRVQLPEAAKRLDAYPHQLSGGQRQRVVIAIALACGPDLLIADEPTTALDVTIQREVLDLIQELVREDGMGLLLISHDLGVMADSVQQLMVMYAGTVVESGPTAAVFERLAHPYTRGLFAARPRLGLPRGTRLATISGRVPELVDMPAGCPFADRCERVLDACRATTPPVVEVGAGHWARCLRVPPQGTSR